MSVGKSGLRFRDIFRQPAASKLSRWQDRWAVWRCEHDSINRKVSGPDHHEWTYRDACMWCGLCSKCGERHSTYQQDRELRTCPNEKVAPPTPNPFYYLYAHNPFSSLATAYASYASGGIVPILDSSVTPVELPKEKRSMPVVGYRAWYLPSKSIAELREIAEKDGGLLLSSNIMRGCWKPGANKAIHGELGTIYGATKQDWTISERADHPVPAAHCDCGYYVMSHSPFVPMVISGWSAGHENGGWRLVLGAVQGWGRVIQHGDEGWRAEYVRILALCDGAGLCPSDVMDFVADFYKVPILGGRGMEALIKEFGDPLPSLTDGGSDV